MPCEFELAWRGTCLEPKATGYVYCTEHKDTKCVSCGHPATHECEDILGSSLCGAPLCSDCKGSLLFSQGTQSHTHQKKEA